MGHIDKLSAIFQFGAKSESEWSSTCLSYVFVAARRAERDGVRGVVAVGKWAVKAPGSCDDAAAAPPATAFGARSGPPAPARSGPAVPPSFPLHYPPECALAPHQSRWRCRGSLRPLQSPVTTTTTNQSVPRWLDFSAYHNLKDDTSHENADLLA